jgi:hypothetical protein
MAQRVERTERSGASKSDVFCWFLFGFESQASNHVTPTQNLSGRGVSLLLLQKRASEAVPFLLTEPAKSGCLLFAA